MIIIIIIIINNIIIITASDILGTRGKNKIVHKLQKHLRNEKINKHYSCRGATNG